MGLWAAQHIVGQQRGAERRQVKQDSNDKTWKMTTQTAPSKASYAEVAAAPPPRTACVPSLSSMIGAMHSHPVLQHKALMLK